MERDYPLSAARTLRATEEDAACEQLAARIAAHDAAASAVARAQGALAAHRDETRAIEEREAIKDAAGRTAGEMTVAHAFLSRRGAEARELHAALERAQGAEREAAAAVDAARDDLAQARAAREAVEKHHDKWAAEKKRSADAKQEAEGDDVVAAAHVRRRQP